MSINEILENIVSIDFMHNKIMELGDERAEEIWFMTYPDGANREDVKEMAKDAQIMEWLRKDYQYIMNTFV